LVDVVLDQQFVERHRLREPDLRARQRLANRRRAAGLSLHAGTVALLVVTSTMHAYRHGYTWVQTTRVSWLLAYFVVLAAVAYATGLPDAPGASSPYLTAALAALASAALFSMVQLVRSSYVLPRFVVFATAFGAMFWWGHCAAALRRRGENGDNHDRVIFLGRDSERDKLRLDLTIATPERAADIVSATSPVDVRGLALHDEPLVDRVIECGATVLVLGQDAQHDRGILPQVSSLHEAGVRVRPLVAFYDEWLGKLPVSELERMSLMFDINEIHGQSYSRIKRMLDIGVGLIGCVALVVVTPFILFGNLFANRGPLLYRQPRVGRNQRTFRILKFRTMRLGDSTDWTTEDDPRITKFGHFLRRTHLDELPQFVNILRGELSIVGPRPEQPRYVATLEECLPFYQLRHLVRPGLTGWAQVKYGYAGSERDALEKLQYDFYYLGHQNLILDLRIIARTIRGTLVGSGR
jgi:lipopolysaccharide/colanic/teichoic acid biosynthesis glycosyltransferase